MIKGSITNRRMLITTVLAMAILLISFQILISMEASLEEGRGPQVGSPFATLLMMVLISALIVLMLKPFGTGTEKLTSDNVRIAAIMSVMFVIGLLVEPVIPRLGGIQTSTFGAIIILIPIFLIAAMLVQTTPRESDEEE